MYENEVSHPGEEHHIKVTEDKPRSNKSKRVLLLVGALLIVAGLGLVGFIWNSQIQKYKNDISEQDEQISKLEKDLAALRSGDLDGSEGANLKTFVIKNDEHSFTISHSGSWTSSVRTIDSDGMPEGWVAQEGQIVSPSGEVIIKTQTGVDGIGGACLEEESGTISFLEYKTIPKMNEYSVVYYSSDNEELSSLAYQAAIMKSSDVAATGVGKSVCDLYLSQMVDFGGEGATYFSITSNSLDKLAFDNKSVSDDKIKEFFESAEFAEAVKILQTLEMK